MGSNRSNISKGQRTLAQMIAAISGSQILFEVTWPWLLSDKRRPMYADIYVKDYNLIIEFQGPQHYFFPNVFHKTYNDFLNQRRRDEIKKKLLLDHGLRYIAWRYNEPLTYRYVIDRLRNARIRIPDSAIEKTAKLPAPGRKKVRRRAAKKRSIKKKNGTNSR